MAQSSGTKSTANNLIFNQNQFINYFINQALLGVNTAFPAIVKKVNNEFTLNIQPVFNVIAEGQPFQESPLIENVPISHIQAGIAGLILNYEINDVVLCVALQRDITNIKNSNFQPKTSNPPTFRKFSMSDCVVIGKLSNVNPNIYIRITKDGIDIDAKNMPININSPNITLGNIGSSASNVVKADTTILVTGIKGGPDTVQATIVQSTTSQEVKVT